MADMLSVPDEIADLPEPQPQVQSSEPTDSFAEPPQVEPETVMEAFPNYAEQDEIVEKVKIRLKRIFSNLSDRSDLESIWKKNDQMYRVKPDDSKDDKHRANESTGVFHISVNQLVSMAFKTFTDNPDNYKYGFRATVGDTASNNIRAKNAEIMTLLFRKAQVATQFKRNLKKALLDCYQNGNCFVGIPWEKQIIDLFYRDKTSGERKSKPFTKNNLPGFETISIDRIWLDENIDDIDEQPGIFIKYPIDWTKLIADSKKNKVKLFEKDGEQSLRDKFAPYLDRAASTQFSQPQQDRMGNADRTAQDRTSELYKHWFVWVNLPINKDAQKWDDDEVERRFRVRIVGDPESCEVIEVRENIFPGGVPILAAHQTEDNIGMYHISLGEKIETYFDQICIAIDQLIDNRSKNVRRPIVRDPMRVDLKGFDFGHSNVLDCQGDVRSALMELQISDMTATIMPTIQYLEQKVREIMNTTDAVMGVAMGARTSASEFMSAKASATTPIYSDMASIEDALIGEYMRRFSQYIHTFMDHNDIVDQIGIIGAEFQFDLNDIYTIELMGVTEAMDKATKVQNLLQLLGLTQDAAAGAKIKLRLAEAMGIENPAELVPIPAQDQALKAALWENNEILAFGKWDEPQQGEMHDIHLAQHLQAVWDSQREENPSPNIPMMIEHISKTRQLQRMEQAQAGVAGFNPVNGQAANPAPTPGLESGQQISGAMGDLNAGSPIPAQAETASPEAM